MADTCGSSGIFARIAYDASATGAFASFTSADIAFALTDQGESLAEEQPHINIPGLNGETAPDSEHTRSGLKIVRGDINLLASPDSLQTFMPHVLGNDWDIGGESWPSTAVPPKFHILTHRDALLYPYFDLYVNQLTLSGSPGEPIRMTLSLMGINADTTLRDPSLWPTGLNVNKSVPYMFHDTDLDIDATAYKYKGFTWTYNNNLVPIYMDEITPCGFKRGSQASNSLQLVMPHTSANSTNVALVAAPGALDVTIDFTSPTSGQSASINFPALQIPRKDPGARPGEILFQLDGVARRLVGAAHSGADVTFTNDNVT